MDLPSAPSKAVKRVKPAKKKAKAAMVHLASSPSKVVKRGRLTKNEREEAMVDLASSPSTGAMVHLVSSPSEGVSFMRYTREKTRAQRNLMIVPHEPEPARIQSIDTNEVRVLFNDKIVKKMQVYFMLSSCFNFFFFV